MCNVQVASNSACAVQVLVKIITSKMLLEQEFYNIKTFLILYFFQK
uniref:Uncharacterized protein n=1 Tax=Arundo donax TaxID=35708 RepID=A0A0A9EHD9_ARUDO